MRLDEWTSNLLSSCEKCTHFNKWIVKSREGVPNFTACYCAKLCKMIEEPSKIESACPLIEVDEIEALMMEAGYSVTITPLLKG